MPSIACLVVVDEEVLDVEIHVVRECRSTVGHDVFRFNKGQMFCGVNWWKTVYVLVIE